MHIQRSIAKAKRKQQKFVISVTVAVFIGCFIIKFLLCKSQILYFLVKAKDSHLRNYLEVHSLSLNLITRKSLC